MRLTMGIASTIVTGLCIGECMYAICLYAYSDPKASEQDEHEKVIYRLVSSTPAKNLTQAPFSLSSESQNIYI